MKNAIFALMMACAPALCAGLDFDIKGIELGMTVAELRAVLPGIEAHCGRKTKAAATTSCMYLGPEERGADWNYKTIPALDSFAGVPVRYFDIRVRADVVVMVAVRFRSSAYDGARGALVGKYGPPQVEDKDTALWRISDRTLGAGRHAGSRLWSGVTLSSSAEIERQKKDRAASAQKDL